MSFDALRRLLARLGLAVPLGRVRLSGWTDALPVYLFRCRDCGRFVATYPQGHGAELLCPTCTGTLSLADLIAARTEATTAEVVGFMRTKF